MRDGAHGAQDGRRSHYARDTRAQSGDLPPALPTPAGEIDQIMEAGRVSGDLKDSPGEGRHGRRVGVAGMRFHRLNLLRAAGWLGGELK